jgi:hypothetical protein
VHIGELVVALLEDQCGYPPGAQIVIDNDATFSLKELYKVRLFVRSFV